MHIVLFVIFVSQARSQIDYSVLVGKIQFKLGQGRLVFARDLGKDNETLIDAYEDGPFYLYTYMRKHREAKLHKYYKTGNGWELRRLGTYPKSAH